MRCSQRAKPSSPLASNNASTPAGRAHALDAAVVVGHRLRAERAQVVVVGRGGGADHARAPGHRQLHRDAAQRAGGAVDEQGVAGADLELAQGGVRGLAGRGQGAGDRPGHGVRLVHQLVDRHRQRFGVTHRRGPAHHFVAGLEAAHAGADLIDHAGELVAEPAREARRCRRRARQAAAQGNVAGPHAGRAHPHPDFAGGGLRHRQFDRAQHFRRAVAVEHHGLDPGGRKRIVRGRALALEGHDLTPDWDGEQHRTWT
nr:hypothetical protein [Lysobacter enzymogenes]